MKRKRVKNRKKQIKKDYPINFKKYEKHIYLWITLLKKISIKKEKNRKKLKKIEKARRNEIIIYVEKYKYEKNRINQKKKDKNRKNEIIL